MESLENQEIFVTSTQRDQRSALGKGLKGMGVEIDYGMHVGVTSI